MTLNASTSCPPFTDMQGGQFEQDGYARLGRLLSDGELSALRTRIDDLMLGNVVIEGIRFQLDGDSSSYFLAQTTAGISERSLSYRRADELHLDELFLTYMRHPLFREITRRYIGDNVSVFRSMFMNKPANKGTELPWHQDVGKGWGIDSNPTTTVWTALDDATVDTGCMQIVPGSHKLGILNESHFASSREQQAHCSPDRVIDLEVPAGEAVLIHNWMLHRSGVNATDRPRRAFSIAYMDAGTRSIESGDAFPVIFGKHALQPRGALR